MARIFPLLFIFSVFACIAFAATELNPVIAGYLSPGETFTKTLHSINGSDYYFVSINGSEAFIIAASDARVISSLDEIHSLILKELDEKNVSMAAFIPTESERNEIWRYMLAFNASRKTERDCEEIIGIDRFPCYDLETCWRACYTPACQTMKIGSGEFFLGHEKTMWMNKTAIDNNLTAFHDTLYGLSIDRPDVHADFDALLENIKGIRESCGALEVNPIQLKDSIGFCYPITFEYGGIINASAGVAMHHDALQPLFFAEETASALSNSTAYRLTVRENNLARPRCLELRGEAEQALALAYEMVNRALYRVSAPGMAVRLHDLDGEYTAFNCSDPTSETISAFNSSFLPAASALERDATESLAAYQVATEEYVKANQTLALLIAKSPGDPDVAAFSARVSAAQSRLYAMPAPEELAHINSEFEAVNEAMEDKLESIAAKDSSSTLLIAGCAGALIIAIAAFLAGKFLFKKW